MAKHITDPANPNYGFGTEFDYAVWTAGTQLDLVNVPWNNDYRDVVKFDTSAALDTYIDSLSPAGIRLNQVSYVKPGTPVRINIPHNKLIKYNYIRVSNPLQPITPEDEVKNYYYFILDVNYIAPNTSEIIVQLDLWQTYVYNITLGMCYVERGHIGIANEKAFDSFGREYLTVPEGLDVGGEYQIAGARQRWVLSPTPYNQGPISRYPSHDVLVFSTTDLFADAGTVEDPNLVAANGSTFQGTIQGCNVYIFDPDSFYATLNDLSDKPWVSQGIVSVTMIPKVDRYHPGYTYSPFPLPSPSPALYPNNVQHAMFPNWRDSPDFTNLIPARYRHLLKFKTYPYTVIQMTTFNGSSVLLKPESWNDPDAVIQERASLVPPQQRIMFSPHKYNAHNNHLTSNEQLWPPPISGYLNDVEGDDYGEYLDVATQISNLPQMSIVNDGAISWLAANQHSITAQFSGADWTQQRALGMAQGQYDIATGAMHAAMDMSGIGVNADIAQTANQNRTQAAQQIVSSLSQLAGAGGSAGIGAAMAGPAGAAAGALSGVVGGAAGAINTGIGIAANDESLAIRSRAAAETVITQNKQQQLMRDTNKGLADFAARGDYAQQINALNAKVQDATMIQPSQSGQIAGEAFNIVNGGLRVSVRWKILDAANFRAIGEFWLRYGYAIRAAIVPPQSLKVMSKFTYWKMSETYISASRVPEGHKQGLRGILEKGVTVWSDPSYIGTTDWADNVPLGGISY